MITILYLPLDDRPCNNQFPFLLPRKDYQLLPLPTGMLGNKKSTANLDIVNSFLLDNANRCDAYIISLDTLIYGGLIPSRLHHFSKEELLARLDILKKVKLINPNLKIYAFSTIMRCPNTNFDSEEPTYWSQYGKNIFRYGQLKDLEERKEISLEQLTEFSDLKKLIPNEVINDFTSRRYTNLFITDEIISLYQNSNLFSFLCLPQDDSNPIGWTTMDQNKIKLFITNNNVQHLDIYPGADEVGMVLLARVINDFENKIVRICIKYAAKDGQNLIPPYEDRKISSTISSQLNVAGIKEIANENEADIVVIICIGEFSRTALISEIKDLKNQNKIVGLVDTYLPSGSDIELIEMLRDSNLILDIDAYASWNTASNSFGTVLAESILYFLEKDETGNKQFLIHRYVDDYAYCTYVRGWTDVNAALARGFSEAKLDGINGTCTQMCHDKLLEYLNEHIPSIYNKINDIKVSSPWNRSFEMKFDINYKE